VIPNVGLGPGRLAAEATDPVTSLVLVHPAVDQIVQACNINNPTIIQSSHHFEVMLGTYPTQLKYPYINIYWRSRLSNTLLHRFRPGTKIRLVEDLQVVVYVVRLDVLSQRVSRLEDLGAVEAGDASRILQMACLDVTHHVTFPANKHVFSQL